MSLLSERIKSKAATKPPSSLKMRAPSCFYFMFRKVANSPRTVRLSASTCPVGPRSVPTRRRRIRLCREAAAAVAVPTPAWPRTSKRTKKKHFWINSSRRRKLSVCLLLFFTTGRNRRTPATSSLQPTKQTRMILWFFFFVTKETQLVLVRQDFWLSWHGNKQGNSKQNVFRAEIFPL